MVVYQAYGMLVYGLKEIDPVEAGLAQPLCACVYLLLDFLEEFARRAAYAVLDDPRHLYPVCSRALSRVPSMPQYSSQT